MYVPTACVHMWCVHIVCMWMCTCVHVCTCAVCMWAVCAGASVYMCVGVCFCLNTERPARDVFTRDVQAEWGGLCLPGSAGFRQGWECLVNVVTLGTSVHVPGAAHIHPRVCALMTTDHT